MPSLISKESRASLGAASTRHQFVPIGVAAPWCGLTRHQVHHAARAGVVDSFLDFDPLDGRPTELQHPVRYVRYTLALRAWRPGLSAEEHKLRAALLACCEAARALGSEADAAVVLRLAGRLAREGSAWSSRFGSSRLCPADLLREVYGALPRTTAELVRLARAQMRYLGVSASTHAPRAPRSARRPVRFTRSLADLFRARRRS